MTTEHIPQPSHGSIASGLREILASATANKNTYIEQTARALLDQITAQGSGPQAGTAAHEFATAIDARHDAIDRGTDGEYCVHCTAFARWDSDKNDETIEHKPDCIVLRARAYLAASPAPSAAQAQAAKPMEYDDAHKLADALYAVGYDDRKKERDYDPRGSMKWQAVVDALAERPAAQVAQGEPIYQARATFPNTGGWSDVDKAKFDELGNTSGYATRIAHEALPQTQQTKIPHHFLCERKGHNPLCPGCEAERAASLRLAPARQPGHPADWTACERIADLPAVDEALRGFSEDPTGDNGTMVVRAVLESLATSPAAASNADREIHVQNAWLERAAHRCDLMAGKRTEAGLASEARMAEALAIEIRALKIAVPNQQGATNV